MGTFDQVTNPTVDREALKRQLQAERTMLAKVRVALGIVEGARLYDTEYPPRQFIVDGMVKHGDLVMLAGRPKSGKSWLLLQLAQALDTGTPFLGRTTTKARVLFVALEDGERRIYERLHIRKWRPSTAAFVFEMLPLGEGGVEQIKATSEAFDVIIIDTLRAALGAADENDNAQMSLILQSLADYAHETGKTIFISHHTRKGDSNDPFELIRGASAARGAYDIGLLLARKNKEREAVLYCESRDVEAEDMTLEFDASKGWTYEGDGARIEEIRAGRRAVKALSELGDGQPTEVIAQHLGITRQAALKQLEGAERDGLVRRTAEANDGKKPRDLWYLA